MMVSEKVRAAIGLQTGFMTGTLGLTLLGATQGTLRDYRHKTVANRKRLG